MKSRGAKKMANPQQVVYEFKHRVVTAMNKIADRDTYQIGVQELEKAAESLSPDGVVPFLSCILDPDSEQKSAVRKECVRMMGVLVKLHGDVIGPHLGKMVSSIVKRLKDQDSIVRDTCVETMGVFASEFGNQDENDGVFVLLVRPLFEALGDQNKQIQAGAAMCLARVIDNMNDPPVSILQKMLARTMKLLKNSHFKAKPAVIELNKSLIQAGGALSHSALSTAIRSIQEALKDSDWTTRKAASLALGDIASGGGPFLAPFKASCIQALESCRFDKVKPVRDTVLHALHCWKSIERHDVPEPSDTVSSIKGSFRGDDYGDLATDDSSMWKDVAHKESKTNTVRNRAPVATRKEMHNSIPLYLHNDGSESSSAYKTQETVTADVISMQGVGQEYDPIDDKQEYSSASNHVSDNFTNKFMSSFHNHSRKDDHMKLSGDKMFGKSYMSKAEDRRSLDSTVTEAEECHSLRVYCSQTESEIGSIQKKLLEIEKKQSSLMDILQGFTTSTMETLSVIQLKVSSLEHAVDRITHDLVHGAKYSDSTSMRHLEKYRSTRKTGNPAARPSRNKDIWEGKSVGTNNKSSSVRQPLSMVNRNFIGDASGKSTGQDVQNMTTIEVEKMMESYLQLHMDIWNHVKDLLCEGDLDSAYREALCSGNQLLLIELIDGTGPVLDATCVVEHRIVESIIPWLQQIVDLSALHGPSYISLSVKLKREILSAVQEALDVEVTHPMKRRTVAQMAMKLQQIWG
ncbi:TORTIFOLIA1-like protein 2 [Bienertia sinuspersici]